MSTLTSDYEATLRDQKYIKVSDEYVSRINPNCPMLCLANVRIDHFRRSLVCFVLCVSEHFVSEIPPNKRL